MNEGSCHPDNAVLSAPNGQRDLEYFLHALIHDLAGPLRRQAGLVEIIVEDHGADLSPGLAARLAQLKQQGDAMSQIVAAIGTLRELGLLEPERRPVAVQPLVERLLEEAGCSPGADPDCEMDIDLGVTIEAYPKLVHRLFAELIDNTLRHGSRPLELSAHVDTSGTVPRFDVVNRWPAPEGDRSSDAASAGSGLALCQRIVERHHGRLWLEPDPEYFTVRFTLSHPY